LAELRNPNAPTQGSGGGDMRSMLAFMVLALVALLAFQYFKPPTPASLPPAQQTQTASPPATSTAPQSGVGQVSADTTAHAAAAAIVAAAETQTIVENELYKITFSNKGAQVTHWILKRYKDSQGHPLDLVNQHAAAALGYPLSIFTYEPSLTTELNQALYQASATGTVAAPAGVTFKYAKGPLTVTKTFMFNESYVIDTQVSVTRSGSPVRALIAWPSGLGDQEEVSQYNAGKFAWSIDGKRDSGTALRLRRRHRPLLRCGVSSRRSSASDAGYAAQRRRCTQRRHSTQQREIQIAGSRSGCGRHERRYPHTPFCRTTAV